MKFVKRVGNSRVELLTLFLLLIHATTLFLLIKKAYPSLFDRADDDEWVW